MSVVFVVGEPGVGKTTAVRSLIERGSKHSNPKWTIGESRCFAGHYTGGKFDGADTVPYNGVQKALQFWETYLMKKRLTVLDGDRFSNEKVLKWFQARTSVSTVLLHCDEKVAQERRVKRGSAQNESWVRGRKTKSERFWSLCEEQYSIDTSGLSTLDVAKELVKCCQVNELSDSEKMFKQGNDL